MSQNGDIRVKKLLLSAAAIVAFSACAAAADLPARPYTPVVAAVPVYNWSGIYGGVNVGGGWGPSNWLYDVALTRTGHQVTGGFAGFQAGYNYQIGSVVLGIEGDYSIAHINGSSSCPNPVFVCSTTVRGVGDVAGRIGFAWDRVLFYAKGGEAWALDQYRAVIAAPPNIVSGNETRAGWLGGLGAEYAVDANRTVKIEYDYMDFGTRTVTQGNTNGTVAQSINVTQKLNIVKVGLNFKFGGPIVAKF
jgi:outer membrane immunogenic protein